jgi:hypothetical protein
LPQASQAREPPERPCGEQRGLGGRAPIKRARCDQRSSKDARVYPQIFGKSQLIEGAFNLTSRDLNSFYIFSESDLLPLVDQYLDPVSSLLKKYNCDFIGKNIRDITSSSNGFFADAVSRRVAGLKSTDPEIARLHYYHCIGCFFGVRGTHIVDMLRLCERMKTLYFEVMFPTAAIASGCAPLSIDSVSDYLKSVRYRPFFDINNISHLEQNGTQLVHPVKGSELLEYLNKNIPTSAST